MVGGYFIDGQLEFQNFLRFLYRVADPNTVLLVASTAEGADDEEKESKISKKGLCCIYGADIAFLAYVTIHTYPYPIPFPYSVYPAMTDPLCYS